MYTFFLADLTTMCNVPEGRKVSQCSQYLTKNIWNSNKTHMLQNQKRAGLSKLEVLSAGWVDSDQGFHSLYLSLNQKLVVLLHKVII